MNELTGRLKQAAWYYRALGLSVIALNAHKRSIGRWKPYQEKPPGDGRIEWMFGQPEAAGIAVICGPVSGNLEVIDMDLKNDLDGNLLEVFLKNLRLQNAPLLDRLVIAQTRSGGYHFFYRCETIGRNSALARRPATASELLEAPDQKIKVLIETRAKAGYAAVYPTPGYRYIQHDLRRIPVILPQQREQLLQLCRGFDKMPEEKPVLRRMPRQKLTELKQPFNDYNQRSGAAERVMEMLKEHGWTVVGEDKDKTHFRRPGQTDHESSGNYDHSLGLFSVFTSSSDFVAEKGYKPAAVFAILKCGGDFRLAAKRLLEMGYGEPYRKNFTSNKKRC